MPPSDFLSFTLCRKDLKSGYSFVLSAIITRAEGNIKTNCNEMTAYGKNTPNCVTMCVSPRYMINGFRFRSVILLLFKTWVIFFVFPMLRLYKRKPHTYTLMLICSQVSHFFFKQFLQKQPSIGVLIKWCSENMQQVYRRTPIPKFDFRKVAKHFYWNHTSAWVLSCKFAA